MAIDIESLGFTKEELQQRVIDQICSQLLHSVSVDEEGDEHQIASQLQREMAGRVRTAIDESVTALADKHVLPKVDEMIRNIALQETTRWGEKKGQAISFTEYLIQRAQAYMVEKVDYEGREKGERDSYSWNGTQTRITHMIHKYLQFEIEKAMKQALEVANGAIATGIQETVKLTLSKIVEGVSTSVKLKG